MNKPTHYRMVEGVILGLDDENRLIGFIKPIHSRQASQNAYSDAVDRRLNKYSKRI